MIGEIKTMSLNNLRKQWEKGFKQCLIYINKFNEVVVLLEQDVPNTVQKEIRVHHYFQLGEEWNISVKYAGIEMKESMTMFQIFLTE